jgi:hypothetical protein
MVRKQAELYKSRAKLCSCVGVILPKTIGFAQDSVDCLLFCTVYGLLTLASEKVLINAPFFSDFVKFG